MIFMNEYNSLTTAAIKMGKNSFKVIIATAAKIKKLFIR